MNRYQDEVAKAAGRAITTVDIKEDEHLVLTFDNGSALTLWDDGQCCCESRYMSCDDDLAHYSGALFNGAEVRDCTRDEDDDGEVHEVQFLLVNTSLGAFTVANHNRHNGYYGGFDLAARFDARAA